MEIIFPESRQRFENGILCNCRTIFLIQPIGKCIFRLFQEIHTSYFDCLRITWFYRSRKCCIGFGYSAWKKRNFVIVFWILVVCVLFCGSTTMNGIFSSQIFCLFTKLKVGCIQNNHYFEWKTATSMKTWQNWKNFNSQKIRSEKIVMLKKKK